VVRRLLPYKKIKDMIAHFSTLSTEEHPGFEKNRKSAKIHILQRARDLFSNGHFAENRNELNR
jgi:hypothetical protein